MSWLVRRYVADRTDITLKSREQYEWAIAHIENGLGAIQFSIHVATWFGNLADVGRLVLPRSLDRALERIVADAELPRLTSHGLRHTAATHMVQGATNLGELCAIADLLGHSPEMLMNIYAKALPQSQSVVVDRIGGRTT